MRIYLALVKWVCIQLIFVCSQNVVTQKYIFSDQTYRKKKRFPVTIGYKLDDSIFGCSL